MLRLNRLQRSFHTSAALQVFKKKATGNASSKNLFKRGTPKKTAGSIQNFRKTAAYGQFARDGVKIEPGQVGSAVLQLSTIPEDGAGSSNTMLTSGSIVQYDIPTRRSLSYFGSFQRDQHHELFRERTTMIREPTIELNKVLDAGCSAPSSQNRLCLIGDRGVGKSTALAHAHALALLKGYVVVPVPYAQELVSGRTDALHNEKYGFFAQPMYVKRWMKRIAKGNKDVLQRVAVPKGLPSAQYEAHSPKMAENLYNFLLEGRRRRDAFVIMDEFLQILSSSSSSSAVKVDNPPPVLFTLDELNAFCHQIHSENRDTHNRPIYHGHLQVPKYFLRYLSGEASFANGVVIAATSGKYRQNQTVPMGLGIGVANAQDLAFAGKKVFDNTLAAKLSGVRPLAIHRYSEFETDQMLQLYRNAGLLGPVSESAVDQLADKAAALSVEAETGAEAGASAKGETEGETGSDPAVGEVAQPVASATNPRALEQHLLAGVGNARELLRTCIEFGCK